MSEPDAERSLLDLVIPKLEDAGYEVYRHPPRHLLPAFMGNYIPDAIAIGMPKNLAIEIVREDRPTPEKERNLVERFSGVPDWDLRIYYARPGETGAILDPLSRSIIETKIDETEGLLALGKTDAALLIGWSVFEAIGRSLIPGRLGRAQSTTRLIELLANEGIVTPDEADQVRGLAVLRNRIAHGALDTPVTSGDIEAFIGTLKLVLKENPGGAPH